MNKRLYLPGLLSVFLLGTGVSCKDKDKDVKKSYCAQNPSECPNIQGVKNYFLFKEGSWWVYEEETSLERDSVYVTESINNTSNYDFDMRVYSAYEDYSYHYYPYYSAGSAACTPNGNVSTSCIRVKRAKYKPGESIGESSCFMFAFKVDMYSYTYAANAQQEGNRILIEQVFPSYVLGDLNFNKTVKVHELFTFIEHQQPTNHFFAEHVGLVRKELIDSNEVWNLVSYHIAP